MSFVVYALLGLASGAIIGFIAVGIVVGYRASGVVNLAQGAVAMYVGYVYFDLRTYGMYPQPIIGLRGQIPIGPSTGMSAFESIVIALVTAALLGLLLHQLVFKLMRGHPPLGQVVASLGVLILLESIVTFRFSDNPVSVTGLLPESTAFHLDHVAIPADRILLTIILVLVGALLWALFRFTRFGLVTRGAAEDEKGAVLLGYSPDGYARVSWMIAAVIGGLGAILSIQVTGLTPTLYALIVIPSLAACLAGRLSSFGIVVAVSLAIGMGQGLLNNVGNYASWWPAGMSDALPFVVIVIVMFIVGRSLPTRGALSVGRLPKIPKATRRAVPATLAFVVVGILLLTTSLGFRVAITTSLIGAVLCLSMTVLTGYVGQISLFQLTLSGGSAFLLSLISLHMGVPFPFSFLLASIAAAFIGLLAAIPALRVRGINLAIVTLAFAFGIEQTIFTNNTINGNYSGGLTTAPPHIFGLNLEFISGASIARPEFGFFILVVTTLAALGVSNIRRSRTGHRMLAVRSDEQAAAAAGISVSGTKITAFMIAGFLAGISGALTAYQVLYVTDSNFTTLLSISILAIAYLGGITSIPGAFIGGTLAAGGLSFYILDQLVFNHLSNGSQLQYMLTGLGLIVTAILNPEGISGASGEANRKLFNSLRRPRTSIAVDSTIEN